jgi:hypothetical protein
VLASGSPGACSGFLILLIMFQKISNTLFCLMDIGAVKKELSSV